MIRLDRSTPETDSKNEEEFDNVHVYIMIDDGDQSKTLMTIFDSNSYREEKRKLGLNFVDRGSCIISLPNSRLFCCGNRHYSKSAFSYIIDTKNWSYTMLPPKKSWFFYAGGVYYKENVYIFGGQADKYLSQALNFNLIESRWKTITKLPSESQNCSCITFNNKLLLSGSQHSQIYLYDFDTDSYSIVKQVNSTRASKSKYLVTEQIRAYLVDQLGDIYESEILDEYSWKMVRNVGNFSFYYDQMHYVLNKNVIYIGSSQHFYHEYYEFNLDRKTFERIEIKKCSIF